MLVMPMALMKNQQEASPASGGSSIILNHIIGTSEQVVLFRGFRLHESFILARVLPVGKVTLCTLLSHISVAATAIKELCEHNAGDDQNVCVRNRASLVTPL